MGRFTTLLASHVGYYTRYREDPCEHHLQAFMARNHLLADFVRNHPEYTEAYRELLSIVREYDLWE